MTLDELEEHIAMLESARDYYLARNDPHSASMVMDAHRQAVREYAEALQREESAP